MAFLFVVGSQIATMSIEVSFHSEPIFDGLLLVLVFALVGVISWVMTDYNK